MKWPHIRKKKIMVFVAPARKYGLLAPKTIGTIFVFYLASWRVKSGRFESEERLQPHTVYSSHEETQRSNARNKRRNELPTFLKKYARFSFLMAFGNKRLNAEVGYYTQLSCGRFVTYGGFSSNELRRYDGTVG
jgi:hypothetical protein